LFFLERKNQRTFVRSRGVVRGEQLRPHKRVVAIARLSPGPGNGKKSFCFFFFRKKRTPSLD
jgi:hypothetical protein